MSQPQAPLVTSRTEQGILVLTITEAEIHSDELIETLYQQLIEAVASPGPPRVAVDFSGVKFISAGGLRAMLNFRRHVRQREGKLILAGLSEEVAEVFFATKLVSTTESSLIPFAIAPDTATAVGNLSKFGLSR